MDKLTPERRSANMRAITSKDTKPELIVRRLAHALGYRFRLHSSNLPGKPDLVFASKRRVIFVHGCFWHQHPISKCLDARRPKSNRGYWQSKLDRNIQRDARHSAALQADGWKILVIWDCETKSLRRLEARLRRFLESN